MIDRPLNAARYIARQIQKGRTPRMDGAKSLAASVARENLDYQDRCVVELSARDNTSGGIPTAFLPDVGPDLDQAVGKLKIGDTKSEYRGNSSDGDYLTEQGNENSLMLIEGGRMSENEVVSISTLFTPTGRLLNGQLQVLNRSNPERSVSLTLTEEWLLSQ